MGTVSAEVRYLNEEWRDSVEIPRIGSRESRRANTSKQTVEILDARSASLAPSLDKEGFLLVEHEPGLIDFHDAEQVKSRYYPQVESVIKGILGPNAQRVFFSQHVVRTEDTSDFNKAYARFVHCDYSQKDARKAGEEMIAEAGLDPSEFADAQFVWFNSWQPIERPAIKNPLAVVDANSLAEKDVVDYYYDGFGKENLTAMPVFNPDHRFYYYPEMGTDEMLLIKQLDTRENVALMCPHTSFENADAATNALPRRSVEVRFMCVLDR